MGAQMIVKPHSEFKRICQNLASASHSAISTAAVSSPAAKDFRHLELRSLLHHAGSRWGYFGLALVALSQAQASRLKESFKKAAAMCPSPRGSPPLLVH